MPLRMMALKLPAPCTWNGERRGGRVGFSAIPQRSTCLSGQGHPGSSVPGSWIPSVLGELSSPRLQHPSSGHVSPIKGWGAKGCLSRSRSAELKDLAPFSARRTKSALHSLEGCRGAGLPCRVLELSPGFGAVMPCTGTPDYSQLCKYWLILSISLPPFMRRTGDLGPEGRLLEQGLDLLHRLASKGWTSAAV